MGEQVFQTDMQHPDSSTPRLLRSVGTTHRGSMKHTDIDSIEGIADTRLLTIQEGDVIVISNGAVFGVLNTEDVAKLCSKHLVSNHARSRRPPAAQDSSDRK